MWSFSFAFVTLPMYSYTCQYSLYINELEQRFNFLSVFLSISPRGQFVCVRVGSFVFLKFFLCFVSTVHYVHKKQSQRTCSIILFRTMKFYNFILESIRLWLQPPVSGVAVSLLVSVLTVVAAISQWRRRLSACVRAHGGHFEHIQWCFYGIVC